MNDAPDQAPDRQFARQLLPAAESVLTEAIYADLRLPSGPPERPYVIVNMVSTVDGKVALAGRARGIGSRLDRDLMRRIRAAVDAVMVGAGTLRAEAVDPRVPEEMAEQRAANSQRAQPLAVTISRSLRIDPLARFLMLGREQTLIFTTTDADPRRVDDLRRYAMIERAGAEDVDVAEALRLLRQVHGVERLLVEGGPTMNQALLDCNVIDELFITISPKLAGGSGLSLISAASPSTSIEAHLHLVSLYEQCDELFVRYRVTHQQSGSGGELYSP